MIAWLCRHPRVTFQFTPTSASWLNALEGFFATLTKRRLRRGSFLGVVDLQSSINRYLAEHNADPKPFRWKADPDAIIAAAGRGHRRWIQSTSCISSLIEARQPPNGPPGLKRRGAQRIGLNIQARHRRAPAVAESAPVGLIELFRASPEASGVLSSRPKKGDPLQRVPVMAKAIADRLA